MPNITKTSSLESVVPKTEQAICRICNREDDEALVINIKQCAELIIAIAQFEVKTGPQYPELVCNQCFLRLHDAYTMHEMCIASEQRLLAMVEDDQDLETNDIFEPGEIVQKFDDDAAEEEVVGDLEEELKEESTTGEDYMEIETLEETETYMKQDDDDDDNDSLDELEALQENEDKTDDIERKLAELDGCVEEEPPKAETNRNKVIVLQPRNVREFSEAPKTRKSTSGQSQVVVLSPKRRFRSPLRPGETRVERRARKQKERRQQLIDSGANKYISHCCQCSYSSSRKNDVKRHFEDNHVKMRPLERPNADAVCYLCWVAFDSMSELVEHLKNPEIKLYQCENCEFSALTLDLLRRHNKNSHGIEEIYRCDLCPREFNHQSSLKGHKDRVHYGITYQCDICGQSFKHSDNLRGHRNVHEGIFPYACHVCEFRTARKSNLDAHMRSHTKAKPYKCPYCDKRFSFVTDRKRHIPVHTGVYPYTCSICDKGFIRKKALNHHMGLHKTDDDDEESMTLKDILVEDSCSE